LLRPLVRAASLAALILLPGCNVTLTLFSAPAQAMPGATIELVIAGNISGTTGEAGCVLQLPVGWTVPAQDHDPPWVVVRDSPALLAAYVPEPGHYLVGYSGTGTYGTGGSQTISQMTLSVWVQVPASAQGQFTLKLSLAGSPSTGAWQIQEPVGISQFAAITAAPYALPIYVSATVLPDFVPHNGGLLAPPALWSGVAFGDVDGDGRDDLAAASSGAAPRCWLSRQTTWIERSTGLATVTQEARMAFGHLDGDGFLDLVTGNGHVYFGDGGNTWTLGPALPLLGAGTNYRGVATGDLDGDGLDDIAIGPRGAGATLKVLLNNGNRTFRDASTGLPVPVPAPHQGWNLILEDFNGDGNLDMAWAQTSYGLNLWFGNGQGGWTQGFGLPPSTSLAATDFDGDGAAEIVITPGTLGIAVYKYTNSSWTQLQLQQPGLPTTGSHLAVAVPDVDRDGLVDIVAAPFFVPRGLDVWRNTGSGFAASGPTGLPPLLTGDVTDIVIGDVDGNVFPDVAIAVSTSYWGNGALLVFRNVLTGVEPFGTGCAAASFPEPALVALGEPRRGNASFAMQVQGQVPGAYSLFWFGANRTSAPPFALPLDLAPFGATGCTLWAAPEVPYFSVLDSAGEFSVGLPVPNLPELFLATVLAQAGVVAPGANQFGMVFSRGAAIRIK
jgi:hypothetical protein